MGYKHSDEWNTTQNGRQSHKASYAIFAIFSCIDGDN